jgi:hypothetical protein
VQPAGCAFDYDLAMPGLMFHGFPASKSHDFLTPFRRSSFVLAADLM